MSNVKIKSYVSKAIKANEAGTDNGLLKTAILVTNQAKALAPVDKGQLRGSIMWKGTKKSGGLTDGSKLTVRPKSGYIVGSATEHAVYQEFGTRKMSAQPFLRPAIDIITRGVTASKAMAKAMLDPVKKAVPK